MLLLNGLSIVLLLILLAVAYRKYWRIYQLGSRFPGPSALPIIGNAHHLVFRSSEFYVKYLFDKLAKYGNNKFIRLWVGPELILITSDMCDVEHVLSSTSIIEKSSQYRYFKDLIKDGIIISGGQKWFQRRKLVTPSFHFQMLEQFIRIFEEQSQVLVQKLRSFAPGEKFEFHELFNLLSLDIICETAMGVKRNAQTNPNTAYIKAIKTNFKIVFKRVFNIFYRIDWIFYCLLVGRRFKRSNKIIHDHTHQIILQRREELLKVQKQHKENSRTTFLEDIGLKRKLTLLDLLLQSEIEGKPLSNLDIHEEVNTFMLAGHDTIVSALQFFFYNIANNPECQRKCYEEINAIFGTNDSTALSIENLNKLHYVELCIKETLRLFPSAPMFGRTVTQECEINGKLIPKGANIVILPLHIGRLAEYYPEPHLFKPERFDVVTSNDKTKTYSFIPFSAGPRNCVGQKYAMLELKTVIMNVLRNFVVEFAGDPNKKLILTIDVTLGSLEPLMFQLKQRI